MLSDGLHSHDRGPWFFPFWYVSNIDVVPQLDLEYGSEQPSVGM